MNLYIKARIKELNGNYSHYNKTFSYTTFEGCDSLTLITIPSTVTTIDKFFPTTNNNLESFYSYATTPPTCNSHFAGPNSILFVPEQSVNAYKEADYWKDFIAILPIADDPTGISRTVVANEADEGVWYSLDGVKLHGSPTTSGTFIYIKDGKARKIIEKHK